MTNQLLEVVAIPEGLLLEWGEPGIPISENSLQFQKELYRYFDFNSADWLLKVGFSNVELSPSLSFWRDFAEHFINVLVQTENLEEIRERTIVELDENSIRELLVTAPLFVGSEHLNLEFLSELWNKLNLSFCCLLESYEGSVEDFLHSFQPKLQLAGRVFFHLVENKEENTPFAFLATYSTRTDQQGSSRHLPLKHALREFEGQQDKLLELLATVSRAAKKSDFLKKLIDSGDIFHPLGWGQAEAFTFLKEVSLYECSGVICRIPNWWKANVSNRTELSITVGDKKTSFVGMDAILECSPSILIDGVEISKEEAEDLLKEEEGLALIKNRWIAVDQKRLEQALGAYKEAEKLFKQGGLTFREAMNLHLSPERFLGAESDEIELGISQGEWLEELTKKLANPKILRDIPPAEDFMATLRPYQQTGVNWLVLLESIGCGACLADDMGLGKTVQILAFLNAKKGTKAPALLVVPASLISNWVSEINKFSPKLQYFVVHPSYAKDAKRQELSSKDIANFDLLITTYGMAQRQEFLQNYQWNYLILDEAQAIKNPGTKQTRTIKQYKAKNRIILTGTPVENHLSDLWSLFDFLNPGLLGNLKEFKKFSKTLKDDRSGYSRLRKVVQPYILRRLKTDKTIISDLPDKIEMKSYAELSKKQVVLYRKLLTELEQTLETSEGITRKGIILASLVKFKQLCNHPDQFFGSNTYEEEHSGKFVRLRQICETILEKREKVLIFTQFKELTEPLAKFLTDIFGYEGLILHGSVAVKKRKSIVESFQKKDSYLPFMVLSLKAGGVGLNLTEANNVVHFDRWWNPAVENQATDRAFRIGQKRKVVVHKFITQGTIEERIDEMLEEKQRLTKKIVGASGENMITELKTREVLDLFKLRLHGS